MLSEAILRYGYALIFVAAAVEGDATLVTATFLAHRGYFHLYVVMVVVAVATIAINQVYFWLARRYGSDGLSAKREGRAFGKVLGWVERFGLPLVVFSRFAYGFRIAIPAACGASGMSPLLFTLGDVAGAAIWAVVIGFAGYAIGHFLEQVVHDLHTHEGWVALALLVALLAILACYGCDRFSLRALKRGAEAPDA
jgi:membrane protein DedA with SNARE-associated domain